MEDHRDALFFWESLQLRDACCVHVDAHLDTCEFELPLTSRLDEPEINCGNYLLHAIRRGVVNRVIWVIPPHLCQNQLDLHWAMAELSRWNLLKIADVAEAGLIEGRVEVKIDGCPLTICTSDHLPSLDGPCLLDIDADYFLGENDEVWETPFQLHQRLCPLQTRAVTVAYSVQGGYTPVQRRYLGNLTELLYQGQGELARNYWQQLSGQVDWQRDIPAWLEAARLVTQAHGSGLSEGPAWQRAAELDPGYTLEPFDLACQRWQRRDFAGARRWLRKVEWVGSQYLLGLVAHSEKRHGEAVECWGKMLEAELTPAQQSHLHHLRGLALMQQTHPTGALAEFQLALQAEPRQAGLWRELARAQAGAGLPEEASKSFRKAIKLAPLELASLQARLELAELYLQLGQVSLLQAELRQLRSGYAPGEIKMQVERLAMQAWLKK